MSGDKQSGWVGWCHTPHYPESRFRKTFDKCATALQALVLRSVGNGLHGSHRSLHLNLGVGIAVLKLDAIAKRRVVMRAGTWITFPGLLNGNEFLAEFAPNSEPVLEILADRLGSAGERKAEWHAVRLDRFRTAHVQCSVEKHDRIAIYDAAGLLNPAC